MKYTNPLLLLSLLTPLPVLGVLQIVPGATWTDTTIHHHVQAHGGGILQVGSTYYWVGEDRTDGSAFQNVTCYSSTDLVQWSFERALLTRQASGDLGPDRVVERPKVVFNEGTGTYVMYMHIDSSSYGEAKVGVATASSACGEEYSYLGSFQPLGFQSRDMNLFVDDDGTGYLLTEDRANGLRIDQLTDDYLNVSSSTYLFSDSIEAPAMVKQDGVYFIFGSRLTGWDPNDNLYATATNLSGPWSDWTTFAPAGTNTFNSQTNFILPLNQSGSAIYMGDRWVSSSLGRSTYIWLPLTLSGSTASMPTDYTSWVIDAGSGTWAAPPTEVAYPGETATLAGGARNVSCSGCDGGLAAGYIGGDAGGTATFAVQVSGSGSGGRQTRTLRFRYANGDATERRASVVVNGGVEQVVAFLPTGGGNVVGLSEFEAEVVDGMNEVVVGGVDGGWGPDVDALVVPDE